MLVVAESCRAYGKSCKICDFCRVLCKNRIGTAARSGDQVQISWQAWYFVTRVQEVAREMLVSVLSHVSLRVSGCAVSMGEAAKPYV